MNNKKVEVMFWKGNEAIRWGTQTKMLFKDENQVAPFLNNFICEGCTEVTVDIYIESRCVDSYSYNVI